MRVVGVPKEIKAQEGRVGLTPAGALRLHGAGHEVRVERGAGVGSGFSDAEYGLSGARLVDAAAAWDADLVVKVKEPLPGEYGHLRGQLLFTYLHLAAGLRPLTLTLCQSGTTAVAYETVEDGAGALPLLAPMSAVAGDMAPLVGAHLLARHAGGRGMLLGRVLGRSYGKVVVLGDGVVGRHAARTALGLGAHTLLFGRHPEREPALRSELGWDLEFVESTPANIARHVVDADLVVGAVLVRGGRAPHLVGEGLVHRMMPGAVVVDVSIDQGGCVETSMPTTHADPVVRVHDVLHYGVTNMPGAYPRTATLALTEATLPRVERLAAVGLDALREDAPFACGVNVHEGFVTCREVAEALGLEERYRSFAELAGTAHGAAS